MKPTTITRYILRGRTAEKIATTATAAAASQAYYAMLLSTWARADDAPNMPPHQWSQSGFSRSYDACKYCGDYAGGYQHAYAAAACYTLAIPQDALTGDACDLQGSTIDVYGDRWLADGAILTAVLSASAEPPSWSAMLASGTHSEPLMAVVPSNTGLDSAVSVEMAWTDTAAPAYVHLVLRLADYTTVRGAWIEGSAILDSASIDLSFSRAVEADPGSADDDPADDIDNLVVPIRVYNADAANRNRIVFSGGGYNLESVHLRRNWAADMLRGGNGASDATDNVMALTPAITESGLVTTVRGYICKCWCPIAAVAGSTAWFRAVGSALPLLSSLRVSLFTSTEMPDPEDTQTWSGAGSACVGTAVFTGLSAGNLIGVPLQRAAASPLWIVASFDAIARNERAFGDTASGISLVDAHIAALPVVTDSVPCFVAVGPSPAVPIALMRDPDGSAMLPAQYAFDGVDYVGGLDTSFAWLSPGDVGAPFFDASLVSGSANQAFAAVIDTNGAMRLATAGTLPAGVANLEGSTDYIGVATMFGATAALLSTAGAVSAVGGPLATALVAAINNASISGAAALCGRGKCLLVCSGSAVAAVGNDLAGAFVSAVAALTGVASGYGKIALGAQWAAFVKTDGTAAAIKQSDGTASATVAGWSNVIAIATAGNTVVAVDSAKNLLIAGGDSYAGLGDTDIAAHNEAYKFNSIIGGVNKTNPSFFAGVEGVRD